MRQHVMPVDVWLFDAATAAYYAARAKHLTTAQLVYDIAITRYAWERAERNLEHDPPDVTHAELLLSGSILTAYTQELRFRQLHAQPRRRMEAV